MENIPIRHLSISQKEPDLSENFSIRDLSILLDGNDMVQALHRHDFFYLLALKNASGEHTIDFVSYTVHAHTVFFMRPGQVHELVLKAGSTGYLLQFGPEFYFSKDKEAHQILRKASLANSYQLNTDSFQQLNILLNAMFQEFSMKKESFKQVIKANMNILFIELVRQQKNKHVEKVSLYTQEKLEKFLELLETHIFTHKQVVQYADMLNLSPYQLNAIAKATLGKTCSELINEHIVLEAKRCLLATSNQINQTAYRLGYEDVSYFVRFFKKQTGYSPDAFRHNFR